MLGTQSKEMNINGRVLNYDWTPVDRFVSFFSARKGMTRARNRVFEALAGAYHGASTSRRQTQQWSVNGGDADSDILWDLDKLRQRSRDLIRNAPIATGAIGTSVYNVVGTGLKLQSRIDSEYLGLTEDQADAWQDNTEREFRLWAESIECDYGRELNFSQIQALAFRQALENGDCFCLTPRFRRSDFPYSLKLQLIEADRCCNKDRKPDKDGLVAGIQRSQTTGEPIAYHFMNQNPDVAYVQKYNGVKWQEVSAYNKAGLRNVIHLIDKTRPGQSRGVPFLAPIIEQLRMLASYTDNELMAATVASLFTVFLKSESGDVDFDVTTGMATETGAQSTDDDLKLGNGAIIGLKPGEDINIANPSRPNSQFDPFIQAILVQIGAALNIPYEVLIRHFSSSYSASRAALLEAWRFFKTRRKWLVDTLCQPIYETWLYEAVAIGRVSAPGFFADPMIRKAYCGAAWGGDSPGYIDPKDDVEAARERIDGLFSTYDEETTLLTGGDFEYNMRQRAKEKRMITKAGLEYKPAEKKQKSKDGKEAAKDEAA